MHWNKRLFDLVVSAVALPILLPVILVIAVLIRMSMGSPVFFKQLRPGFRGRPFQLFKFRTMTDRVTNDGILLPDAKRLTPLGKLLRSFSLDELPELWNILRGEMSFVGPRPLLMEYLELYSPSQMRRHEVVPGLTGWAQVKGRNAITWEDKFKYDVWYVDHWSFWLDLKIILMTVWKVLSRQGISQEGHVTMEAFSGGKKSQD